MRCNQRVTAHYPVHVPCFRQVLDSSVEIWTELLLCICDPMGHDDCEVLMRSHSAISDTVHSEWKRVCKRLRGEGFTTRTLCILGFPMETGAKS